MVNKWEKEGAEIVKKFFFIKKIDQKWWKVLKKERGAMKCSRVIKNDEREIRNGEELLKIMKEGSEMVQE